MTSGGFQASPSGLARGAFLSRDAGDITAQAVGELEKASADSGLFGEFTGAQTFLGHVEKVRAARAAHLAAHQSALTGLSGKADAAGQSFQAADGAGAAIISAAQPEWG